MFSTSAILRTAVPMAAVLLTATAATSSSTPSSLSSSSQCQSRDEKGGARNAAFNLDDTSLPCVDDLTIKSSSWGDATKGVQWMLKYDTRTRAPKWAFERFTSLDREFLARHQFSRKKSSFKVDGRVEVSSSRTKPTDFSNSGFDRGHMIPAADCQQSQQSIDETFTMANICPQNPTLNKGFWNNFESWIRLLVYKYDIVEVVTGPVYAPVFDKQLNKWIYRLDVTGEYPRHISVPSHFFKVIKCVKYSSSSDLDSETNTKSSTTTDSNNNNNNNNETSSSSSNNKEFAKTVAVGAFLIENNSVPSKTPISHYAVKIEDLELLTGVRFFHDSLKEPARCFLDGLVPDSRRDIDLVLNGDSEIYSISDSLKDAKERSNSGSSSNSSSNNNIKRKFFSFPPASNKYINDVVGGDGGGGGKGGRRALESDEMARILHLCQLEDCNKPFPTFQTSKNIKKE